MSKENEALSIKKLVIPKELIDKALAKVQDGLKVLYKASGSGKRKTKHP